MRICAVIATTAECRAYLSDGTSVVFPSDSEEADTLIHAIPEIAQKGYADIDLVGSATNTNVELGLELGVQLCTCAKEIGERLLQEPELLADIESITQKYLGFLSTTDTLVAVKNDKVLTGIERLNAYIKKAVKLNQYTGLKNLLERCFKIADTKAHSVDDLLTFLAKADLPIADDGSIIAYKRVNKCGNYFVDCHTGKVKQDKGSRVFMKPEMVDPDRSRDCSHGLHIATRHYVSNFYGDSILLLKFNPEDVIAVPEYDPNKIRVCAYEILDVLPKECYDLICQDKPMTECKAGKKLLTKALIGDYPKPCLFTEITGEMGEGCIYGEYDDQGKVVEEVKRNVSSLEATTLDQLISETSKKEILKKIKQAKKYTHPLKTLSNLYAKEKVTADEYLLADALRKRLKKSWKGLKMDWTNKVK